MVKARPKGGAGHGTARRTGGASQVVGIQKPETKATSDLWVGLP